jgi:hypothetical protein
LDTAFLLCTQRAIPISDKVMPIQVSIHRISFLKQLVREET